MKKNLSKRFTATVASMALLCTAVTVPYAYQQISDVSVITANAADTTITINDMPADYVTGADWIWTNRVEREGSTSRRNTIFDQIVAGKGTLNYVVRWQSYETLTYEQRQQFQTMLSDCVNAWTDWLVGYDGWIYDHIDVKIVGWAVIDESCLLDLHDDEVVYTDTTYYDAQYDSPKEGTVIPDKLPNAPDEISRFYHFEQSLYNPSFDAFNYPGGLDSRFDMYLWATYGFPDIGGSGGDWGQRLSDVAYLNMINGSSLHVLEHEIGHGFGMTDFYGGEGESDGFPPGGFPGGENSIMMAGSAIKITDFDGWFLRYMWTKIKDEDGRFDLENAQPVTTATTTETTTTTTEESTTTTENIVDDNLFHVEFKDTITYIDDGIVRFEQHGEYSISGAADYPEGKEEYNIRNYEAGDTITISIDGDSLPYIPVITYVNSIELVNNVRDTTTTEVETTTTTAEETTTTTVEDVTTTIADITTTEDVTIVTDVTTTIDGTEPLLYGDVNNDAKITLADCVTVLQYIANAEKYPLSDYEKSKADVYNKGDGITAMDALAIQKYDSGAYDTLPVWE